MLFWAAFAGMCFIRKRKDLRDGSMTNNIDSKKLGLDLTEGPVFKSLAVFTVPIILSGLIQLYSVVDLCRADRRRKGERADQERGGNAPVHDDDIGMCFYAGRCGVP